MAFNFWFSCLHLLSIMIIGICHHAWGPSLYSTEAKIQGFLHVIKHSTKTELQTAKAFDLEVFPEMRLLSYPCSPSNHDSSGTRGQRPCSASYSVLMSRPSLDSLVYWRRLSWAIKTSVQPGKRLSSHRHAQNCPWPRTPSNSRPLTELCYVFWLPLGSHGSRSLHPFF